MITVRNINDDPTLYVGDTPVATFEDRGKAWLFESEFLGVLKDQRLEAIIETCEYITEESKKEAERLTEELEDFCETEGITFDDLEDI